MRSTITSSGLTLSYVDRGQGPAFIFQHGLGANADQPLEVMPETVRKIVLECRGHGSSELGPDDQFSIKQYSLDLSALVKHLNLSRPIIGGISMGAAIALKYAIENPKRISALILARPAWITEKTPKNMQIFANAAEYMTHADDGKELFRRTPEFLSLQSHSTDNANSILGQFGAEDLSSRSKILHAIANDGPGIDRKDLEALNDLPVLVIGCAFDQIHPISMAHELARLIPAARFMEVTSKSISKLQYVQEFKHALTEFVASNVSQEEYNDV